MECFELGESDVRDPGVSRKAKLDRPLKATVGTEMGSYSKSCGETLHRFKLENSRVGIMYLEHHFG